jgi:hypothetical protein
MPNHVEATYAMEQRLLGIICWTISHDAQIDQMLRNMRALKKELVELYRIINIRIEKVNKIKAKNENK